MIDIHHHCIPGVDDGAGDLSEAIAMCRMALEAGIETIVATPHVLRGRWQACTSAQLAERLAQLQAALGDRPRLLLGSECYFSHDVLAKLTAGDEVVSLAASRYVLLEFASDAVPPNVERPLHDLQLARWVPVIAHPERNAVFVAHPELLSALVGFGARTQVTAGSLLGQFGASAQRAAERWIRSGLVHFLASDAHNVRNRTPAIGKALERLRKIAGTEVAEALTWSNPLAVVENRALPFVPTPELLLSDGFLNRFKSFLNLR